MTEWDISAVFAGGFAIKTGKVASMLTGIDPTSNGASPRDNVPFGCYVDKATRVSMHEMEGESVAAAARSHYCTEVDGSSAVRSGDLA